MVLFIELVKFWSFYLQMVERCRKSRTLYRELTNGCISNELKFAIQVCINKLRFSKFQISTSKFSLTKQYLNQYKIH